MMDATELAELIIFFGGAAAFAGIVRLLHFQAVDDFRSDLFALRDDMFLYALDSNLTDKRAYKMLRIRMNSFIRYAHRLNATRVVISSLIATVVPPDIAASFPARWNPYLADITQDERYKMLEFYRKHELIIVSYLIDRSLVLRATVRVLLWSKNIKQFVRGENTSDDNFAKKVVADRVNWRANGSGGCVRIDR